MLKTIRRLLRAEIAGMLRGKTVKILYSDDAVLVEIRKVAAMDTVA